MLTFSSRKTIYEDVTHEERCRLQDQGWRLRIELRRVRARHRLGEISVKKDGMETAIRERRRRRRECFANTAYLAVPAMLVLVLTSVTSRAFDSTCKKDFRFLDLLEHALYLLDMCV